MRYRLVDYNGVKYGLRKGETVEQLSSFHPEYECNSLDFAHPATGDVKENYLILTPYGLVDRSKVRRQHRKRTLTERPRLGKGSGRAGGARAATHYRSHMPFVPAGTRQEDCYICQQGLTLKRVRVKQRLLSGESDGYEEITFTTESNTDAARIPDRAALPFDTRDSDDCVCI